MMSESWKMTDEQANDLFFQAERTYDDADESSYPLHHVYEAVRLGIVAPVPEGKDTSLRSVEAHRLALIGEVLAGDESPADAMCHIGEIWGGFHDEATHPTPATADERFVNAEQASAYTRELFAEVDAEDAAPADVERVARAIWRATAHFSVEDWTLDRLRQTFAWETYLAQARAAIAAMKGDG